MRRPGVSIIWLPKWSRSSGGISWRATIDTLQTMKDSRARLLVRVMSVMSRPTCGMNSFERMCCTYLRLATCWNMLRDCCCCCCGVMPVDWVTNCSTEAGVENADATSAGSLGLPRRGRGGWWAGEEVVAEEEEEVVAEEEEDEEEEEEEDEEDEVAELGGAKGSWS